MWPIIPVLAVLVAQAQPSPIWCSERDQGAQLCEQTEDECKKLPTLTPKSPEARAVSCGRKTNNRRSQFQRNGQSKIELYNLMREQTPAIRGLE
jgi:hypothetical protein